MKQITVYTDGGAKGNPGRGGFGALLILNEKVLELSGGFQRTTNNRMELLAAITALEAIKAPCQVTLHSDSRYLIDAMGKGWMEGWKARGWTRAKNQYLKNVDLWKRLDLASAPHEMAWRWVKGHSGQPENERCDELAGAAASLAHLQTDHGYLAEEGRANAQTDLF